MINRKINYFAYNNVEELSGFSQKELTEYRNDRIKSYSCFVQLITKYVCSQLLSCVEIGSGSSALLYSLHNKGLVKEGLGIELSRSRYEFAELWKKDESIDSVNNINDDFYNIKLQDGHYDLFLCIDNTFSYLKPENESYPKILINKAYDSLNESGIFILDMHTYNKVITTSGSDGVYYWKKNQVGRFAYSLYKYEWDKKNNHVITESIYVGDGRRVESKKEIAYPYTIDKIKELICDKFEIIDIYSSCECHKYNDQSEDVIVIMRKIH